MGRGYARLNTKTYGGLVCVGNFLRTLTNRQGLQTGSLGDIAHDQGWISDDQLQDRARMFAKIG
ncbi:hypothetical protein [uncultured Tateyamaria sp.]|uniref:hypothetical protein n=1 Tax=uncultured Tateyamaria sp. TaxID=455651 RepID=UPI002601F98F|nr:hypothetical protein [uncultured Tateyamaria sp.]